MGVRPKEEAVTAAALFALLPVAALLLATVWQDYKDEENDD